MSLENLLQDFSLTLKAIWVSRTHNIDKYSPTIFNWAKDFPNCRLIADIEALVSLRPLSLEMDVYAPENKEYCTRLAEDELKNASKFHAVLCVNDYEKVLVQEAYPGLRVRVLGHAFSKKNIRG